MTHAQRNATPDSSTHYSVVADTELVAAAQAGDDQAFAEYKQIIENEAFTLGGPNEAIASIPLDGKQVAPSPNPSREPLITID